MLKGIGNDVAYLVLSDHAFSLFFSLVFSLCILLIVSLPFINGFFNKQRFARDNGDRLADSVKKGNGVRGRADPSHTFGGVEGEGSSPTRFE